jgi:hypothetical protein
VSAQGTCLLPADEAGRVLDRMAGLLAAAVEFGVIPHYCAALPNRLATVERNSFCFYRIVEGNSFDYEASLRRTLKGFGWRRLGR